MAIPTVENADKWLDRIENELSPENLCCDGELRGRPLAEKTRQLKLAQRYLFALKGMKAPAPFRFPRPVIAPTHKVGESVTFRGQQYTVEKVNKVNYQVLAVNGKRYNLRIGAM
jgi:hypothetical protein